MGFIVGAIGCISVLMLLFFVYILLRGDRND